METQAEFLCCGLETEFLLLSETSVLALMAFNGFIHISLNIFNFHIDNSKVMFPLNKIQLPCIQLETLTLSLEENAKPLDVVHASQSDVTSIL